MNAQRKPLYHIATSLPSKGKTLKPKRHLPHKGNLLEFVSVQCAQRETFILYTQRKKKHAKFSSCHMVVKVTTHFEQRKTSNSLPILPKKKHFFLAAAEDK